MACDHFVCGPLYNNCYVVWDEETADAVLVDTPVGSFDVYGKFARKNHLKLRAILLTHGHWDHMAEASIFQEKYSVPLHAHGDDLPMFTNPAAMMGYAVPGVEIKPCNPGVLVVDGDKLQLLGKEWVVRSVAGHTPGGVVYYFTSENLLFSGDSLFRGSVGRSDLPRGDGKLLIEQLRSRVLTLPESVEVLPGHGARTTIGNELRTNAHLRP
ncbi:MAG: MBL fold metallo-hydrolase [Puniceicoccales bacterium]|jgi:glyoxylase-like metal-dependent hydrolase (beta-lactamase superfamily II)|nr:MBL fold metallo-hydrolase [Puniceicoccales bacterium]